MQSKKQIVVYILLFFIVIAQFPVGEVQGNVQYEVPGGALPPEIVERMAEQESNNESLLNNSESRQFYRDNKPSYGERFTAGIIISSVNWVVNLFNMSDPVLLVFGKDPRTDDTDDFLAGGLYGSDTRDSLILGTFPEPFFKAISILYDGFERLLPIPLVIVVILASIALMFNMGSSEGRSRQKDYVRSFIVALVVLRFGHYFWEWLFALNHFFIDLIWAYMMSNGVVGGFFMDMIWGTGRGGFDETASMGSLPLAIILLLAAFMVMLLNYQYTMRMIILGILIVMFPIVATLSVFPAFRQSLMMWAQEFLANVLMQLAHAIALGVFFITLAMPGVGQGANFWLMIAYFVGLPSIVAIVRQMIGLQGNTGSPMGGMGAMMGIMALANMGRMLKSGSSGGGTGGTSGSVGTSGTFGDIVSGGGSARTSGTASGMLSGATSTLGKAAQTGFNAVKSVAKSPLAQKTAKFGLGASAAVAGGMLSTMATGNPVAGMALGMGAGHLASKGLGGIAKAGGGLAQTIGETASGKGSLWENIQSSAMSGEGGILTKGIANTGWGLQRATNVLNEKLGNENKQPAIASNFFKENKETLATAQQGMQNVQPQYNVATAQYEQAKAQYGPGSKWHSMNADMQTGKVKPAAMPDEYKNAEQNYFAHKAQYDGHSANALRAESNMKDYNTLKEYTSNMRKDDTQYSQGRGRI